MFKIEKKDSIRWPVKVDVPRDGGKTTAATFYVTWRWLLQSEIEAVARRTGGYDAEFIAEVAIEWDGLQDSDGAPMPFTVENLARMTDLGYVRVAMINSFYQAMSGARLKNL